MAVGDLTDLEAVRLFLEKDDTNDEQDAIINKLIGAASRAICKEFEREFATTLATNANPATRRFIVDASVSRLDLAPYDVQSGPAITVKLDPQDSGGTTLTEWNDHIWKPQPATEGVYTHLELLPFLTVAKNWRRGVMRAVDITGTWGFPAVPDDVAHWAVVTVATWLRKDVSAFSNVFNVDVGQIERATSLPGAVLSALRNYRRIA